MEVVYLTKKELEKLEKYKLSNSINHIESDLYLFKDKTLLKIFKNSNKEFIMNKLYVLNRLFYLKDYYEFKNIVLPKKLIKIRGISSGFTMEYIKNIDGYNYLNDPNIQIKDKLEFLKNILSILEEIEKSEILSKINFHLGDIHESNFIYNIKEKKVNVVDVDSIYFDGADVPVSKFLLFNDKLWDFNNKYPLNDLDRHIPNRNTTIICYIYILLNFITEEYTPNYSFSKFCETLNILNHVGFDQKLCDAIYNIYIPKNNYFDNIFLDTINEEKILKFRQLKNAKK